MDLPPNLYGISALAPVVLMTIAFAVARFSSWSPVALWKGFQMLSIATLVLTLVTITLGNPPLLVSNGWITASLFSLSLMALVQGLGTVIGSFSSRYLQGEAGQRRYVAMLAAVLACVQLLLLADHWLVLIVAWAGVSMALQPLLCFYPERPFARLAALKKRIADRVADVLLVGAAVVAWKEVGSGSLSALWGQIAQQQDSNLALQVSAIMLVLAVILRTALLPVHGWLIQVMEAPTPVSALLHAGVVNLGGFVLIRFAPLLEHAALARAVLLTFGLVTAVLAGMVMLTRITIKVRLAWSTVAQMGFMLLECALGLYTLAALHLIGHSVYKAHAFLSASTVVRQTRLQALYTASAPTTTSLVAAPLLAAGIVLNLVAFAGKTAWPWWWSAVLGLAWAPLLWMSNNQAGAKGAACRSGQLISGTLLVTGLTLVTYAAHLLPLGLQDSPHAMGGLIALAGMATLYVGLALLQIAPIRLERWRRWSYSGFYLDEAYTRLALLLWPAHWVPTSRTSDELVASQLPPQIEA
ncbi:NADH-quinone oxidoreductase subunit L [Robbsia andropogonis]|uniref:NADH-quinone oxidoreductase subunit L n=1 Tax=Robbsia andropogonis TaxID=28092 RepID=UPI00264658DE|nr:NADH-quinone oxidoreductase subunit L [Robbsia andropogonis]